MRAYRKQSSEAAIIGFNGNEEFLVAYITTTLKNGQSCNFSHACSKEAINADREVNLINAQEGKISRAMKYLNNEHLRYSDTQAKEVNDSEFLLSEWGDEWGDDYDLSELSDT